MEFEEMKKIWDSQNNQPMFVIDERTLHQQVERKVKTTKRSANMMETGLITINVFVIIYLIIDALIDNAGWYQYLTVGAVILVSIYVATGRIRRKKKEKRFDQTLLGSLESAISDIDYLIKRGKTFVWWYILPFAITTAISLYYNTRTAWVWLGITVLFAFASWLPKWEIRKCHLPKKRALESLRKTLTQEPDEGL